MLQVVEEDLDLRQANWGRVRAGQGGAARCQLAPCSHLQQAGTSPPAQVGETLWVLAWAGSRPHQLGSHLGHHVVGPDVGGQGEVSFALPLRGSQQCRPENRGQVVEGHFVDGLLFRYPGG